ncbi:MAG: hypothetical protein DRQ48_04195 [Gammaproteobacteria bacterium]|nr:MAG: hypothetical protein DRQ58_10670 [Gammaproteobacteria bacterium]RKZ71250.1 MAG: hypothetical protein DRQ48_04195 [Gammaproteobacteria bacterium]
MKKLIINAIAMALVFTVGNSFAVEGETAMVARINQQLESAGRDQYDALKDPGRKPLETSRFFGIKTGMTVLDMCAGSGYNTEIISAAVGPDGLVYAENYHHVLSLINGELHQSMLARLENNRLPNVRYIVVDAEDMPFDNDIDIAFWGFNMHDIYNTEGESGTQIFLRGIYLALKPGGILGVSEHVGEAGYDNADLHRLEPGIIMDMLEKAGFTIEATSDLLANPNDDHSQSIFTTGLRYNTDRILVRARKPG